MNIAQTLDQAADSLERVNWKQVTKELIELWDLIWKILILSIIFTHLAGKSLGNWVHSTNDRLAANWVRLIVPQTSVETEQAQIIVEEVSTTNLPVVEVELKLPPPLVIEDPWEGTIEVELMLPLALETMALPFTMPLMLTAVQAPVALLAADQDSTSQEQPPPPARRRRRSSAPRSLEETVNEEVEPPTTRRPRGPKAHRKRVRRTLAA